MGKATEGVKLDKITMPVEVVNEITQKIKERSFIAALVPSEPETFGSKEYVTWTEDPEGEFVGEGEAKSSSSFGMEPKEGKLHKFQVTVRMSDEVTWADEDNQLQILNALYGKMAEAKARGLDYGLGHAINPLTRTYIDGFKPTASSRTTTLRASRSTACTPPLFARCASRTRACDSSPRSAST